MKSLNRKLCLLPILMAFAISSLGCNQKNSSSSIAPLTDCFEMEDDINSIICKMGMDPEQFSLSSSKYTQEFNSSDNIQFDGQKPYYSWNQYTDHHAIFAVDEQGRFRKFRNSDDIFGSERTGPKYSKEHYSEIAHEIFRTVVDNYEDYQDIEENSLICEYVGDVFYACELYMKKSYADGCSDVAHISLNEDCAVRSFSIDYCDIDINALPEIESDFEQQFQDYIQNERNKENHSLGDIRKYYVKVNGDVYGCYTYTINIYINDEVGAVHDAKQVIFRSNIK